MTGRKHRSASPSYTAQLLRSVRHQCQQIHISTSNCIVWIETYFVSLILLQEESLRPGAKVVFRSRSDARNLTSSGDADVTVGEDDMSLHSKSSSVSLFSTMYQQIENVIFLLCVIMHWSGTRNVQSIRHLSYMIRGIVNKFPE